MNILPFWSKGKKKIDPIEKLDILCRETGDVKKFKRWHSKYKDVDLNSVLVGDKHVLHAVCSMGFTELAICLMEEYNVTPSTIDPMTGCTTLHFAVSGGSFGIVEYLVEKCHSNVSAVSENGYTPLHFACREGNWKIVSYLLGCGASYVRSAIDGMTGLLLSAKVGHLEMVKFLVDRKICDINEVDVWGNTALHYGAQEGHTDVVTYLLQCPGVHPYMKNIERKTPAELCEAPALVARIHRLSSNIECVPFVLSQIPEKRISFQKRPEFEDTVSEVTSKNGDPFDTESVDLNPLKRMSQRHSGMSAASLLAAEMLQAEIQFEETVTKLCSLISEFVGYSASTSGDTMDLMLTLAMDRVNTVDDHENRSNMMAEILRRRSYRLSVRSSIGLSLDAKALRELLMQSKSQSQSSHTPTPSSKNVTPTNPGATSFFPESPRTPRPPIQDSNRTMTMSTDRSSIASPDDENEMSRLLLEDIRSIQKISRPQPIESNSDSDVGTVQQSNSLVVDPYICGEEARMLWPGTHTPPRSPSIAGDDEQTAAGARGSSSHHTAERDEDTLLPPPFPASSELFDQEAVEIFDAVGMHAWGSGDRRSPRASTRSMSPRASSRSPRVVDRSANALPANDISPSDSQFLNSFEDAEGGSAIANRKERANSSDVRRTSLKVAPMISSGEEQFTHIEIAFGEDEGLMRRSSIRRPSLKVAPIMSPLQGGQGICDAPEDDFASEEITPMAVSPRYEPPVGRMQTSSLPNPYSRSPRSDTSESARKVSPALEVALSSVAPAAEGAGDSHTEEPAVSTPWLQQSHRLTAKQMLESLRSSESKLDRGKSQKSLTINSIDFSALGEPSGNRTTDSPLNKTPSAFRKKFKYPSEKDNDVAAKNLSSSFGALNEAEEADPEKDEDVAANYRGDTPEISPIKSDIFTPSQWQYLSTLLEKAAAEEEAGVYEEPRLGIEDSFDEEYLTKGPDDQFGDAAPELLSPSREDGGYLLKLKKQELVIAAGHKLAAKILNKYIVRSQFDTNIDRIASAWGRLLQNAKRPLLVGDEAEVDEWTLRYKRFTQKHGSQLGIGLRVSAGAPQNYAPRPEPIRSKSVDRALTRAVSSGSLSNTAGSYKEEQVHTQEGQPPRAADDGSVVPGMKASFRKTFLAPLWIPPPDEPLNPIYAQPLSNRSGYRVPHDHSIEGFPRSPRDSSGGKRSTPQGSAVSSTPRAFGPGSTPKTSNFSLSTPKHLSVPTTPGGGIDKSFSFGRSGSFLTPPATPTMSQYRSLRNPIKQEEEEIVQQLALHHQLHAARSSSLGDDASEDNNSVTTGSSIVPPPLDWSKVDLKALGVMPDQVVPTFKANEVTLWRLYAGYVLSQGGLSPSLRTLAQSSTGKDLSRLHSSRRMLTFEALWMLLRDFEICPGLCSKKTLLMMCQDIMATSGSRSGGGSSESQNTMATHGDDEHSQSARSGGSAQPQQTWDFKKNKICFVDFKKVLWRLARDCVKSSVYAHPALRLCKLFRCMDSGNGRVKLSKMSRSSALLPPFVLFEATTVGVPSTAFSPPSPQTLSSPALTTPGSSPDDSRMQGWPRTRSESTPEKPPSGSPLITSKFFASMRAEQKAPELAKRERQAAAQMKLGSPDKVEGNPVTAGVAKAATPALNIKEVGSGGNKTIGTPSKIPKLK